MNAQIRFRVLPALIPVDGKDVQMQVTATHIQWRLVGEDWEDLIAIADLIGADGPAIELRSNGTSLQYRVVGDVTWIDIIPLTDLQGPQGEQGGDGPQGPSVSDGSKGDIVVSGSGAVWSLAAAVSRNLGISVFQHGAVGDGTTDDSAAFIAAQAAAVAAGIKIVRVPAGDYRIASTVDILSGVIWRGDGAATRINTGTASLANGILRANQVNDWGVIGLRLIGTRASTVATPTTDTQHGLVIVDGDRYYVEDVIAQNILGRGFYLSGSGTGDTSLRGDRGRFVACGATYCSFGRYLAAGAGAEYTSWLGWNASGNYVGDYIAAGNTATSTASIVDNSVGVRIGAGTNHGHGSYSGGSQINHNTKNIEVLSGVVNGFTFSPCNIYDGEIDLNDCAGIVIEGGKMDVAAVTVTSGANSGPNYIRNVWWDDVYGPASFTGTGITTLVVQGCTGPGVPSRNTFYAVEVHAYRNKSTLQTMTSGGPSTTIILPSETADFAGAYNTATGVFTVPAGHGGLYEVTWDIVATGTGVSASGSYIELQADTAGDNTFLAQSLSGASIYSTTTLTFEKTVSLRVAAGTQLRLLGAITGGGTLGIGSTSWYSTLSFKKLGA